MGFLPFARMWERIDRSRADGDTALLLELLYFGEFLVKLTVAALVSSVEDDRDRHRYRQLHRLARADSLGEWVHSLEELLTGPTAQFILEGARQPHRQLTERVTSENWQHACTTAIHQSLSEAGVSLDPLPLRLEGRRWFTLFATLRNRTRGHGAPTAHLARSLCLSLENSIRLIANNYVLFQMPWAYLHRNLSGKYRVAPWNDAALGAFGPLKSSGATRLMDGVYVSFDRPVRLDLVFSNVEASDIFLPNGNFDHKSFEILSYITGHVADEDSTPFMSPATALPASKTEGMGTLDALGECFTNLPPAPQHYVSRRFFEEELGKLLHDDRHPIVTLAGRGGIGKTSVALAVLHKIALTDRFAVIAWLSARDVDLLETGPKPVRPQVLTTADVARDVVRLLEPAESSHKGFKPVEYLARLLAHCDVGPVLFVLDNFETMRVPQETFGWIDTYIRNPNKVLITTRSRDFRGDYPIEITGMTEEECEELVDTTSIKLGIRELISTDYLRDLYRETDGHPYVIKILLGEIAGAMRPMKIERIVATKDDILTALFERTYSALSPAAKRVFLTLCGWRSLVPQLAIEAVLLRQENERLNVDDAILELTRASLIEQYRNQNDDNVFLGVPVTAAVFGKRKLAVSPMAPAIEADLELLRTFGPSRRTDVAHGLDGRIERVFAQIASRLGRPGESLERYIPILEFIARRHSQAWLLLARLYEETQYQDWVVLAKDAVRKYLESAVDSETKVAAWRKLVWLCESSQDIAGEAHALLELARVDGVSFATISSAASRLNGLFSGSGGSLDPQAKRVIAEQVAELMESRLSEANATDVSRLAWLYLHLKREDIARELTQRGLALQPTNIHIGNLAQRLGLTEETQ